jgi:hypothetical protein
MKKEIEEVIAELRDAMFEMASISKDEENIKLRKQAAQKRLSLAREAVRSVQF